jgi:hypothetical protein
LDSRAPSATIDGQSSGAGLRPAGSVTRVRVRGRAGVPQDVGAAALNLTVVNPQAQGYATAYPCDAPRPNASTVNFGVGATIANGVIAKLDGSGDVCIYTHRAAQLVLDVTGSIPG